MTKDQEFINNLLLTCPVSGTEQTIVSIRAGNEGLDYVEIIIKGEETSWKHKIYTEEV